MIDAGVAVKALVDNPDRDPCWDLLAVLAEAGRIVAPELWAYETTSAFTKMVRFEQLTDREAEEAMADCDALGVELVVADLGLRRRAFAWSRELDRASAYDGFYVALAERLDAELWTTDGKLARAAGEDWVRPVPGLR